MVICHDSCPRPLHGKRNVPRSTASATPSYFALSLLEYAIDRCWRSTTERSAASSATICPLKAWLRKVYHGDGARQGAHSQSRPNRAIALIRHAHRDRSEGHPERPTRLHFTLTHSPTPGSVSEMQRKGVPGPLQPPFAHPGGLRRDPRPCGDPARAAESQVPMAYGSAA